MPWALGAVGKDSALTRHARPRTPSCTSSLTLSTTAVTTPRPKHVQRHLVPRARRAQAKASQQRPMRKRMPTSSSERTRVSRSLQATSRGG